MICSHNPIVDSYILIPDLQWFAANTVQNGKKAGLKGVLEHLVPFVRCSSDYSLLL